LLLLLLSLLLLLLLLVSCVISEISKFFVGLASNAESCCYWS
jgi:hypothetical protein